MIIGTGKGKVGNVVFSTLHGEQITKVYQPDVKNPKSYAQMYQRAKFANAVKFYQRAMAHFFSFAFEDQAKNESYYNAFMRHNVKYSIPLSKPRYNHVGFPALGNNWQLSQGSLNVRSSISFDDDEGAFLIGLPNGGLTGTEAQTVGTLSKALVKAGAEEGDIVTIVYINKSMSQVFALDLIEERVEDTMAPQWTVAQFFVNSSDDTPLTAIATKGFYTVATGFTFSIQEGGLLVTAPADDTDGLFGEGVNPYFCKWMGLVVTRRQSSKLLATTSYLVGNSYAQQLQDDMLTSEYIDEAVSTWQNDVNSVTQPSDVILKGAVANGLASGSEVTGTSEEANGSISSVNGGTSIPVTLPTPTVGKQVNMRVQGVNLDKISFTGTGLSIDKVVLNNLNTEAVIQYTPLNDSGDLGIYANGDVIASYAYPTFAGLNGQSIVIGSAALELTNSEVLTCNLAGSNLSQFTASQITTTGSIKKSGKTEIAEDGKTITFGITAKSGAADGSTGTVSVGTKVVATVTVHQIAKITGVYGTNGLQTSLPASLPVKDDGTTHPYQLAGENLNLLDSTKFTSSNKDALEPSLTVVTGSGNLEGLETGYFLTLKYGTGEGKVTISYDGTAIATVDFPSV